MSDSAVIVVKGESPVTNQKSKLYKWDTSARAYYNEFELNIAALRMGVSLLY